MCVYDCVCMIVVCMIVYVFTCMIMGVWLCVYMRVYIVWDNIHWDNVFLLVIHSYFRFYLQVQKSLEGYTECKVYIFFLHIFTFYYIFSCFNIFVKYLFKYLYFTSLCDLVMCALEHVYMFDPSLYNIAEHLYLD